MQRALPNLMKMDDYDLALAYDYETINTSIRESGLLMTTYSYAGLDSGPKRGRRWTSFSHSMGTQVATRLRGDGERTPVCGAG